MRPALRCLDITCLLHTILSTKGFLADRTEPTHVNSSGAEFRLKNVAHLYRFSGHKIPLFFFHHHHRHISIVFPSPPPPPPPHFYCFPFTNTTTTTTFLLFFLHHHHHHRHISIVTNIAELVEYVILPHNNEVTKPRALNTFPDGLAELRNQ